MSFEQAIEDLKRIEREQCEKSAMPFYKGKVRMTAYIPCKPGSLLHPAAQQVFDHVDSNARLLALNFVHEHLCLGHVIESWPID